MGLIMVTCFNSTMTSLLTARILDKEVSLYGTKVCQLNLFSLFCTQTNSVNRHKKGTSKRQIGISRIIIIIIIMYQKFN